MDLTGCGKRAYTDFVKGQAMYFGYLSLGKRAAQRMLAPHYVAFVELEGEEAQAYQLVVSATERTYLPLCQAGHQPPPQKLRPATPGKPAMPGSQPSPGTPS
jgi:hypothetical protein